MCAQAYLQVCLSDCLCVCLSLSVSSSTQARASAPLTPARARALSASVHGKTTEADEALFSDR